MDTKDVVPGERYRVTFTAPEDGMYSFLCAEEVNEVSGIADYQFVEKYRCYSKTDTSSRAALNTNIMLQKGETIIFDAVYTAPVLKSYTLSVVKKEIKPIAAEGTELTLKAEEYQYVSIIPETSSNIIIDIEAAEGICYTKAGNDIDILTSNSAFQYRGNGNLETIATATSPVYIGFYAYEEGTVKVSYKEGGKLEALHVGDNDLTVESDKTISFTAEEDGVYNFWDRDTKERMEIQIGKERYVYQTYLRSGDTALVTIKENGNASRTIVVTKQIVTQMSLDSTSWATPYKLREQGSGWDNCSIDDTKCMILDRGKYIVEISGDVEVATSADYTISYYGKGILADDMSTHFAVNNNESVYVKFLSGGSIQFSIKSDKNVKVEYFPTIGSEAIWIGEGTSISTIRYTSESSEILPCFKITGTQNDTNVDFSYDWVEESMLVKTGENYINVDIDQSNYVGYVDYTYSCEQTGDYNFRFNYENESGISKIEIYSALNTETLLKTIDYSQCKTETYRMVYGTDYRIRIYTNQSESDLYIYPMVKVDNINDVPYEYLVDGELGRFIFIAFEDGVYEFYSTYTDDYIDTCAFLYDATGAMLAENDDGSEDTNFSIKYDMSAGQTVWLETRPLEGIYSSYYVHIDKYNGDNAETYSILSENKTKMPKK